MLSGLQLMMFAKIKVRKKAQTITEYGILFVIIMGALLTSQLYMKRSIQGRLKSAADDLGGQFSPGNTNVTHRIISDSLTHETLANGATRSELRSPETFQATENKVIHDTYQEYWGRR